MPCTHCKNTSTACTALGVCTRKSFLIVRTEEVAMAGFVAAARVTVSAAAERDGVKYPGCHQWILDKAWEAKVQIVNQNGRPVEVDLDCFEPTDAQIDNDQAEAALLRLNDFFRSNFFTPMRGGQVFVTARWRRQFTCVATIIGACHPEESQWWPRKIKGKYIDPRVANDNRIIAE